MAKHHEEEVELSRFEKLLQVCKIARDQFIKINFKAQKKTIFILDQFRKILLARNKVVEIAPLPLEFKNQIHKMGGDDVKLIIQKHVFAADTDMFVKQIREDGKGFLSKNEIKLLPITVPLLIDPNLSLSWIMIRKWNYSITSYSYLQLSGPWAAIRERNNLQAGMVMQVWSFRVDGQLYLALVKVSRDNEQDHGIKGIANTSQITAESHDQQHMMEQINSGNEADRQGAWACCSQAQGCNSFE